ncbi:MAG: trypsin-like peptidase domain-containing protein [Planctomycetales bacterium]|nr:trypsin-like peptidase domain-containing protein [Planctomycetales bacterium]
MSARFVLLALAMAWSAGVAPAWGQADESPVAEAVVELVPEAVVTETASVESPVEAAVVEPPAMPADATTEEPSTAEQPSTGAVDVADHVVKLLVTKRTPDFLRPWARSAPSKASGSGVVLPGGKILTNAHVVSYASEVLVQLRKGGDQLRAKVVAFSPDIDLALVQLDDPAAIADLPGLAFGDELPVVKDKVSVYGYPKGGDDLSITDGIVSRIEFTSYYNDAAGVRVQVDAALNSGNSGGPALRDGKIIGLVFSKIEEADNIGYLIPVEEILAFLDDAADDHIDGRPQLWDGFQTAENTALREFVKLPADVTGVIYQNKQHHDEDYPLQPWDVVTHVGPHSIDNQGYVEVRDDLRMRFNYFIPQLAVDGKVPLTVWRDGQAIEVEAPVSPRRDLVISTLRGEYPEYFIYGPVTFTNVTREMLQALGGKGVNYMMQIDSPVIARMMDSRREPGEEIVVVATRMFPHPSIQGYSNYPFGAIGSVNGVEVKNLRHLAQLLDDCQDEFVRFEPSDHSEPLVFRRDEIEAATESILEDEGIRYQASPTLRDVFEE